MTQLEDAPTITAASSFDLRDGRLHRTVEVGGLIGRSSYPMADPTGDDLGDWWRAFLQGRTLSNEARLGTVRGLDLFCGPGGLALGFSQACAEMGFDFVSEAAIDDDAGAVDVYATNHGTKRRISASVRSLIDFQVRGMGEKAKFLYDPEIVDDVAAELVDNVDVVLAGPPCQGHSNLNNHTRRTDRRNELYLTVPAFAIATGASMVVIENVPAVVHDRQQVVATTKALLESAGYTVTLGRAFADRLGWPQTRQRFFLLARRDSAPAEIEAVGEALQSEQRDLWWAIEDLEDEAIDGRLVVEAGYSDENRRRIDWLFDNGEHNLPPSERPECHQEGTTYNAVYGRLYQDKPAPTITTGFMTPGRGRYIHPTRRRTLTPHEAARLQGFPDSYDFHPHPEKVSAKSQLGKWIGDAVPMPLGYVAGLSVLGGDAAWKPADPS
ncbi:MAG: DNA cytosine methyltransferase [Ilumatobacter sp.]|uniref:DNA cytosine methyltransferase n=1 Tax=Ilumatobacter sp. TaxID=1967498 RepID=UPI003299F75F